MFGLSKKIIMTVKYEENVILNLVLSEIIYHHFYGQRECERRLRIVNVSERPQYLPKF